MIKKITIIILISLNLMVSFSQENKTKNYGFGNLKINNDLSEPTQYWDWIYFSGYCKYTANPLSRSDRKEVIISYSPPKKLSSKGISYNMKFDLWRIVVLPNNKKTSKCEMTIDSKLINAKQITFSIKALSLNNKVIRSNKSTVYSKSWKRNRIGVNVEHAEAVKINITYDGDTNLDQQVLLKGISIKVDGKEISDCYKKEIKNNDNKSLLDEQSVIKLNRDDVTSFQIIKALYTSKVIGLGEFSHGVINTQEVFQHLTNFLVKETDTKVIGMEISIDQGLLYDLYVQGDTSSYLKESLIEILKYTYCDKEENMRFLNWLRAYNKDKTEKIHIVGFDLMYPSKYNLFDYFLVVLGENKAYKYLKILQDTEIEVEKIPKMIQMVNDDEYLKNKIGLKNLDYLKICLQKYMQKENSTFSDKRNRDSIMFEHIKKIDEIYLKENHQILLFAHSSHLSKEESIYSEDNVKRLGCYLNQLYGKEYYNISIQGGTGIYKTESRHTRSELINDSLSLSPSLYCFETEALKLNVDYFFYPSNQIPTNILLSRRISRGFRYSNQFFFGNQTSNFNAYIFVDHCKPIKIDNLYYYQTPFSKKTGNNKKILTQIKL